MLERIEEDGNGAYAGNRTTTHARVKLKGFQRIDNNNKVRSRR